MRWVLRALTGACAAAILIACSSSDGSGTSTTLAVPWRDYEPSLQVKLDAMAAAKDCDGMQLEFNDIGGTNLAVRTQFGHGNEGVLDYIDRLERQANCFPSVVDSTVGSTG